MGKGTILLIDDDEDEHLLFREMLTGREDSITCHFARNAEEGLRILHTQVTKLPDIIFLDLHMPGMDGKECLREIKKIKRLSHIPVIIYTTSNAKADKTDTHELGAADFILKPQTYNDNKILVLKTLRQFEIITDAPDPKDHNSDW